LAVDEPNPESSHTLPRAGRLGPRAAGGASTTSSDLGYLIVAALFALVPFLGKPVHLDDPLFVWTAQQIQEHPSDFYGFDVNWYGAPMPMSKVFKNPPLAAYYIAAVASVAGYNEFALHAAFLLPNLALVCGV